MLTGMVGIWEGWIMQHSGFLRALDRIYRLSLGFQPKEKLISFIFELVFFVRFHKSVSIAFPLFLGNKTSTLRPIRPNARDDEARDYCCSSFWGWGFVPG
jgi:hypothetical protein